MSARGSDLCHDSCTCTWPLDGARAFLEAKCTRTRGVGSFRLPTSEHGTENTAAAVFLNLLLFFIVLHGPDRAKSRRVLHGVVWRLCLFIYCLCRFLKIMASSLSCQLNPSINFANHPNGTDFKTWTTFQIKLYFQNRGARLSGCKHMDSGSFANHDAYNIAGFMSCAYRQTLVGSVRAESYKRWQHDLVVTMKHATTLSGLHS